MNDSKNVNYKKQIINIIEDYPFGLTITEISEKTGFHRNTISKYMKIFESEGLVSKKEIATASVYYTKKRKYLKKDLVVSFLKALLFGINKAIEGQERKYKEIGRIISEEFEFPIGTTHLEEFKRAKKSSEVISKLKLFQYFYNSFDFFQDDLTITIIKLFQNKILYRLMDSEFLEPKLRYLNFFYIACGITEGIYLQNLNMNVRCNVVKFNFPKNNEPTSVDISIQLVI